MPRVVFFLFIVLFPLIGKSQTPDEKPYYTKAEWTPAVGINIPITGLMEGHLTDPLIQYLGNAYYVQLISGEYFFNKNWGLGLEIRGNFPTATKNKTEVFENDVALRYEKRYFIDQFTSGQYEEDNTIFGDFERNFFTLIYRFEKDGWMLKPKIIIGSTSFPTNWSTATLKERGANTVKTLNYSAGKSFKEQFMTGAIFEMGQMVGRRFLIKGNFAYFVFKSNFAYTETIRNTLTDQETKWEYKYDNFVHTLSVGIGFSVILNSKIQPSHQEN